MVACLLVRTRERNLPIAGNLTPQGAGFFGPTPYSKVFLTSAVTYSVSVSIFKSIWCSLVSTWSPIHHSIVDVSLCLGSVGCRWYKTQVPRENLEGPPDTTQSELKAHCVLPLYVRGAGIGRQAPTKTKLLLMREESDGIMELRQNNAFGYFGKPCEETNPLVALQKVWCLFHPSPP